MWEDKKHPYLLFGIMPAACLLGGYYAAGIFGEEKLNLLNLVERCNEIMSHPFRLYWNEKTLPCVGAGAVLGLYFVSQYTYRNRNFQFGIENGSEKWGIRKSFCWLTKISGKTEGSVSMCRFPRKLYLTTTY